MSEEQACSSMTAEDTAMEAPAEIKQQRESGDERKIELVGENASPPKALRKGRLACGDVTLGIEYGVPPNLHRIDSGESSH